MPTFWVYLFLLVCVCDTFEHSQRDLVGGKFGQYLSLGLFDSVSVCLILSIF